MFHPLKLRFINKETKADITIRNDVNKESTLLLLECNQQHPLIEQVSLKLGVHQLFMGDVFLNEMTNQYYILKFDKDIERPKMIKGFLFDVFNKDEKSFINTSYKMEHSLLYVKDNPANYKFVGNIFSDDLLEKSYLDSLHTNVYEIFLKFFNPTPLQINLLTDNHEKFFSIKDEPFEVGILYKDEMTYDKDYLNRLGNRTQSAYFLQTRYYNTNEENKEDNQYYLDCCSGDLFILGELFGEQKEDFLEDVSRLMETDRENIEKILYHYNHVFIGFDENLEIDFIYTNPLVKTDCPLQLDFSMNLFEIDDIYFNKNYDDYLLKII